MWFFFQQPDEFLERFSAERARSERIAQLTQALRGSAPPFDRTVETRLRKAMAEYLYGGPMGGERS